MDEVAEAYVKLALALGRHDPDYVDAYHGPPAWREEAEANPSALREIRTASRARIDQLARVDLSGAGELVVLRQRHLTGQLRALNARAALLAGERLTFDEESRALYDAVAPTRSEEHFQALLEGLEPLLPGDGDLNQRYDAFRADFVIPPERLDAVFQRAIDECRKRTERQIDLPEGESFDVEYVSGRPWSAYNWYRGDFHSLIQVNTELPVHIDRAVDLACHEGYPGHHAYNVLLEKHLLRDRGWVEHSIYPLFSPQSLIAEGSANFGIEIAFPGDERIVFEREELFPLAGLDPSRAERYYAIHRMVERLEPSENEAARGYLDGRIGAEEAIEWLMRYALKSRARAEQRVRFFDKYRSYVINYNLGQDLVRHHVEARGGVESAPQRRWAEFGRLLSSPRLPSGLE